MEIDYNFILGYQPETGHLEITNCENLNMLLRFQ